MCTVTFIPHADTVFITSNRDESPLRQSKGLTSRSVQLNSQLYFPLDTDSDGSWIAMSETGRVVCLLNGGFEPFIYTPPYRLSRGQVVMAAGSADDIPAFLHDFDFSGIAPFTLLIYQKQKLCKLVWDGTHRHVLTLPVDRPQIWSSVTLYPAPVRAWRKSLFDTWLKKNPEPDRESIIAFHQGVHGDSENDFIMNRNDVVRTLSVTSAMLEKDSGSLLHLDLDTEATEEIKIGHGL